MNYIEQLLGQNEEIVLVARQSWVVLLREIIINVLLVLAVIGVILVGFPALPSPWGWLLALLFLLPAFRFAFQFVNWVNRAFIVTNRRVFQVEGLVNKNVVDSSLEKVNDVRLSQSVLGRMLNYGDVEILTASDIASNLFPRISDPIRFKTAMLNEKEKLGFDDVPSSGAPPVPQPLDVPALIASLNALRKEGMITEQEFQAKKAELLARM